VEIPGIHDRQLRFGNEPERKSMTLKTETIEACARAAYETNRAYCLALGDTSFSSWEEAPEWQRETNRKGVAVALAGSTPEKMHESWLAEKRATGWVYGPVKDPEKKEHPCMLPYAELPPEQRSKDSIFLAVVCAVAPALEAQLP
jgi:hypothetical protein